MDLFAEAAGEALPLPDADLTLIRDLPLPAPGEDLLRELIAHTPWREDPITVFGKTYLQPRLSAWYGDPGARYTYSGIALEPLPWTPRLQELRERVEAASRAQFNSVLLNYYRGERDSMGMHADDEPELGDNPVIGSLSLGEERTLVFKHRSRTDLGRQRIALPAASLLIMRGGTQRHWKHGIDKQRRPCGPRVNLTFRQIVLP